jgi:hypothetical protein
MPYIGIALGIPFSFGKVKKIFASDSFNRPDNASSLGNADTGQTWSLNTGGSYNGNMGISSNQAYTTNTLTNRACGSVVDTTHENVEITVTLTGAQMYQGIICRFVDSQNLIYMNHDGTAYRIGKTVNGVDTIISSVSKARNNGDILKVVANGSNICGYLNGFLILSVTCTDMLTATKHGIQSFTNTGRLDNFKVVEL